MLCSVYLLVVSSGVGLMHLCQGLFPVTLHYHLSAEFGVENCGVVAWPGWDHKWRSQGDLESEWVSLQNRHPKYGL